MGQFTPDYLLREQAMVGALAIFLVLRMLSITCGAGLNLRRPVINYAYGVMALLYLLPDAFDLIAATSRAAAAWPTLQGEALGCAVAYLCGSVLHCRLRWHA